MLLVLAPIKPGDPVLKGQNWVVGKVVDHSIEKSALVLLMLVLILLVVGVVPSN